MIILRLSISEWVNHKKDFLAFAGASKGTDGYSIPIEFHNTANLAGEYIVATQVLLQLCEGVSCTADRGRVWVTIKTQSGYYIQQIDHLIDEVNLGLAYTKAPAVATSGTQMKQDLRDLKEFLESIRPN